TSRTLGKLERCKPLGLDVAVVPNGTSFAEAVLEATGRQGVDVVLELVGGAYVAEDVRACAMRGRIVVVGLTGGVRSELDLAALLRKRVEIIGTVLRSRPLEEKIEAAQLLERHIVPWLSAGIVKPVIDRVFTLADAAQAHAHVAGDTAFGK